MSSFLDDLLEVHFNWTEGSYFGPYTVISSAGPPISALDSLAMTHDIAYSRADSRGGHRGRSMKAQADLQMAFDTDNLAVKFLVGFQAGLRVFTFNQIEFPW